jgi:hypothetical protein
MYFTGPTSTAVILYFALGTARPSSLFEGLAAIFREEFLSFT